jgi:hypothetical protein
MPQAHAEQAFAATFREARAGRTLGSKLQWAMIPTMPRVSGRPLGIPTAKVFGLTD